MNFRMLTLAALSLLLANESDAAPLASIKPNATANNYSVYVDGSNLNGAFDTIFFQAKSRLGTFINQSNGNQSGAPRPAGYSFTYPNNMLIADPGDFPGALALTRVGLVNTPQELSYTVGNLGGVITTAGSPGGLFLGNLNLSDGGGYAVQVQLLRAGDILYDTRMIFPMVDDSDPQFPEPSSLSIAVIGGTVSLLAARRRRAAQV